ncbi:hypothetical protein QQX98_000485 [Neonectria punicea]|uniref:Uncharacterized protein n=1 Tax=Neonectria punicea TaxID=979145 RepID=A0ABR1HUG0_9HYPO
MKRLAFELHRQTGSPIPPSLLWLVLENSLLLQKKEAGVEIDISDEATQLEHEICGWKMGEEEPDHGNPDTLSLEDDNNDENSSGSDTDADERGGRTASTPQIISAPLTHAYHTSLLILFFSYTKPTNSLLLSPLRRKLLDQLRTYVRGVEKAEVDVGVGGGIVWPLKVLKEVGLDSSGDKKEVRMLWEFVRGAGWAGSEKM